MENENNIFESETTEVTPPAKKKRGGKILKFLTVTAFILAGAALMGYPYLANWIFVNRADSLITTYEAEVDNTGEEEINEELELARYYNEALASGHVELRDPFTEEEEVYSESTYYELLNSSGTGLMGYISIPCIDVTLPIYHGTDSATLEKGVGHLAGSSLPVGGESTHAVLTGHTGLSSAKMFTDLTELEEGDIFIITVLGQKIAYEVDQILVVEPSDTSALQIVEGEDYCTLVTCTPYGVNTHRLLVRGHRTEYVEEYEEPETFVLKTTESQWMNEYMKALSISLIVIFIALLLLFVIRAFKRRKRNNEKD